MNLVEAKNNLEVIRVKFKEMASIAEFVQRSMFDDDPETGQSVLSSGDHMGFVDAEENAKLHAKWEEIQRIIPPGFSIDGNLVRHLSFNQAIDWLNIHTDDIPRELVKVDEYMNQLNLITYLESLHPEVSRVSETVLRGDIDAGLKTVFASLDTKIRNKIQAPSNASTVSWIGKAFADGVLLAPDPVNQDAARNFLQGVIGYYRNQILHNELPPARNTGGASLSLFALAYESFRLLDLCSRHLT